MRPGGAGFSTDDVIICFEAPSGVLFVGVVAGLPCLLINPGGAGCRTEDVTILLPGVNGFNSDNEDDVEPLLLLLPPPRRVRPGGGLEEVAVLLRPDVVVPDE